jgi:hypothetical protein
VNEKQLKRLKNLNIELLEGLLQAYASIANYCKIHGLPLSFDQKLAYFLSHSKSLIQEINEEIQLPPNLQHRKRTPSEETEPLFSVF